MLRFKIFFSKVTRYKFRFLTISRLFSASTFLGEDQGKVYQFNEISFLSSPINFTNNFSRDELNNSSSVTPHFIFSSSIVPWKILLSLWIIIISSQKFSRVLSSCELIKIVFPFSDKLFSNFFYTVWRDGLNSFKWFI